MRTLRYGVACIAVLFGTPTVLQAQQQEAAVPVAGSPTRRQPPPPIMRGSGPNGATIRCRDGSYPAPMAPDAACEGKGGVGVRYPLQATPQQVAPPAPPPAMRAVGRPEARPAPPDSFVPWRERAARVEAENEKLRLPEGATLRCGDGTWILRDTTSARCAGRGGVQLRFAGRP